MDALAYLLLQMGLEGKGLVGRHTIKQVKVVPDEELPLMLLAQLADRRLVAYYTESLSSGLQAQLRACVSSIEFPEWEKFLFTATKWIMRPPPVWQEHCSSNRCSKKSPLHKYQCSYTDEQTRCCILPMLYSRTMNVLRSLKHRPFALLWTGQTISRLGDSLYRIALAWWVLEKTGSAVAMGTVLVFSQIPMLLFLLIGGVMVDRLPRIRIMFVSDILSGLVITFVAVFSWFDLLQIWHIYIASMTFGFVEAFFFPAYQAVIPQITPSELLTSANSLNGLSQRVTGIIGPALGAALVAAGGTSITFGLDALSFFISALFVLPLLRLNLDKVQRQEEAVMTARMQKSAKEAFKQGFTDLRQGFKFVITVPWIWITILLFGFVNIMEAGPRAVAMPFLIKQDLGADVELLGIFGSAASLGFVIGMLWLGQYVRLHRRGLLGYLSVIVTGAVLLPFAFKYPIPILVASVFIGGLSTSVFALIWTHTLQEIVPGELLGRVYSIDALGSFVLLPVGFSLSGWATDRFGAPTVFLIGGIGTMILASLGLFHHAIRNLD